MPPGKSADPVWSDLGACARALKTMGFSDLVLVRPSRLCTPEHEMAFKMADVGDRVSGLRPTLHRPV